MALYVLDADFYFFAPLYIKDWNAFEREFAHEQRWLKKSDRNKNTIKNFVSCFLGEDEAFEFPMQKGYAYRGQLQQSDKEALSSINGKLQFRSAKNKPLLPDREIFFEIKSNEIVIHITPDKNCALVYIQLRSVSPMTLDEVVFYNYHLHKSDKNQIPKVLMEGDKVCMKGRETLLEIIKEMLPEDAYEFSNSARFLSGVFARLDTSDGPDEEGIADALTRLSLAKDKNYRIPEEERSQVNKLFDNVWTHVSTEGMAAFVLSSDPGSESSFFIDFKDGAFRKSYLPLYLAATLADNAMNGSLRHLDEIADDMDEQDRLRETYMVYHFEPSNFVHLNRFMESIKKNQRFDLKFGTVTASIEARRTRNETIRLKQAEAAAQAQDRRDRNMENLLGFIGLGQVIFAILELLNPPYSIFGNKCADSLGLRVMSIFFVAFFLGLIIFLFAYFIRIRRK